MQVLRTSLANVDSREQKSRIEEVLALPEHFTEPKEPEEGAKEMPLGRSYLSSQAFCSVFNFKPAFDIDEQAAQDQK